MDDLTDIYKELNSENICPVHFSQLEDCVFKQNESNVQYSTNAVTKILNFYEEDEIRKLAMLRTHKLDHIIVNKSVVNLIKTFDGEKNIKSIFDSIKDCKLDFFIYIIKMHHFLLGLENIPKDIETKSIVFSLEGSFENFIRLIKNLHRNNILKLVGKSKIYSRFDHGIKNVGMVNLKGKKKPPMVSRSVSYTKSSSPKVLMLGDTVGTNTTGLLYITSYLRRNGIEAYCQWNDPCWNKKLLQENIVDLLSRIKPHIVGVSIKWFPHIVRSLEICRMVKDFSPSIKIVVGGDTATYYWNDIINFEFIDYIILGEGELPLLKLCQNETDIPNCVYKKGNEVICSKDTYVQTEEHNSDIYLSHMDEIFASPIDPYNASSMFIQTGKGCARNCFYCAGCFEMQKTVFRRYRPYLRNIENVRKDILVTKEYVGTFLYDFELPGFDSLSYYKRLWQDIDLSDHYCMFYFWTLPSPDMVKLISETYKFAYINFDLCSLSETHRMKLTELKVVKPQPTDQKLFASLDCVNQYINTEVIINLIAGLPYFGFSEIEESDKALSKIMSNYEDSFGNLFWGRLHAQPGASLTYTCEQYGMRSSAKTFQDFLRYSEENFNRIAYPNINSMNYPIITYNDKYLESKVCEFYNNIQKKLMQYSLNRIHTLHNPDD